jgi:L-fuconate dehydratase
MLKEKAAGKKEREVKVRELGYPAYVTSVGWLGKSSSTKNFFTV